MPRLPLLLLLAASCGTTLGVIPLAGPRAGETTVSLDAASDVRFWTDFTAFYDGAALATYDVTLFQDGKPVATATCDPLHLGSSRVCSTRVEVGTRHDIHCRMACRARVPRGGPTLVRATLTVGDRPVPIRLDRADLVIRQ